MKTKHFFVFFGEIVLFVDGSRRCIQFMEAYSVDASELISWRAIVYQLITWASVPRARSQNRKNETDDELWRWYIGIFIV